MPLPADPPIALLYVPLHNARALAKARGLAADMLILDLEDAVPPGEKNAARAALAEALVPGAFPMPVAVRINPPGSPDHADDMAALAGLAPAALVVPKVEGTGALDALAAHTRAPLLAMIETPAAVLDARAIAAHPAVAGLIAGLNDLAFALVLPADAPRTSMAMAMQLMVLAARAGGAWAFDGVCNAIDDPARCGAEAAEARRLGFDGKTSIHPAQIAPCRSAFAPGADGLAAARRLVAQAADGAVRHEGRMVEAMHVAAARRLIARAALQAPADAGKTTI